MKRCFIDAFDRIGRALTCRGRKAAQERTYIIEDTTVHYDPKTMFIIKARHGFGDNLMVTAVLESLKQEYPDLQVIVLAKHPEIFANNPRVFRCFDIKKIPSGNPVFSVAVDLEYSDYFERHRNQSKQVGYIDGLYKCLPMAISSRLYTPKIFLTEQEQDYRSAELEELKRPLVAISPYGKRESTILSKIYPREKWEVIVGDLLSKKVTLIQVGLKSEGTLIAGCHDYRDIGYRHTAAVFAKCDAVLANPGGIMHLATACNTPCVVIFGGIEDPGISGYSQNRNIRVNLDCAPCWKKTMCKKLICQGLMPPELILQEIVDLLRTLGFKIQ
jgi:ADP-heptose:LPS heptosyltransferase